MAKKKKKSISKLKADIWKVYALYIKKKYSIGGGWCKCFTCPATLKIGTSNCQCGHYYSKKGYPALYFNENNTRPQCYHCNINLSGNTQIFREALIFEIGEDGIAELDKHRHDTIKWSRSELEEMIIKYKQKVKEL
ncbi:recombination protein NinG [Candidatus Pacearchaeota archaeon]|nr:recombination protein NinG [Candidatus Pacearchaeota archaeon]